MDKIIDIHTHILPGVDDGARLIEDSIKIINYLKSIGISDIVLTSHYIKGSRYEFNTLVRTKILEELNKERDIDVNLYLGNEVYLCNEIIELLEHHEISTLNNSKYMLVELPLSNYMRDFPNILCELNDHGIIPIIAHPERYRFLQKNKKRISEILEFNCLLQCNIDSLTGKYGREAKKVMKWLLKKNLVSFVATDTHRVGNKKELEKAYSKLKKIVGEKKFKVLTYSNPKKVLENKDILGNINYMKKVRGW